MKNYNFNPLLEKLRENKSAGNGKYDFFGSINNIKIFYRYFLPAQLRKIVIVAHGAGGSGDYYVLLADKLFEEGIGVYIMDYRGHGYSEGEHGDIKDFDLILKDFNFFINLIRNRHKDIPLFLFGESMGALVIINFLAKYKVSINGIILFSPAVKLKLKLSLKQILSVIPLSLIYLFAPGVPIINMNSGRNSTGISNPIHLEYDRTDELHLKKISIRYLLTLNKIIKKAFKLASVITQPILIIQGENDPVLNIDGIEQFFDECSSRDKELIIINNATHALFTDPNACFDKQNIWKIFKEWLDKH